MDVIFCKEMTGRMYFKAATKMMPYLAEAVVIHFGVVMATIDYFIPNFDGHRKADIAYKTGRKLQECPTKKQYSR